MVGSNKQSKSNQNETIAAQTKKHPKLDSNLDTPENTLGKVNQSTLCIAYYNAYWFSLLIIVYFLIFFFVFLF